MLLPASLRLIRGLAHRCYHHSPILAQAKVTQAEYQEEVKQLLSQKVDPLPRHEVIDVKHRKIESASPKYVDGKTPVVFIHGFLGNLKNWLSVGRKINQVQSRPVYAVDMRNHGSSQHASPMDNITMTRDLEKYLEEHIDQPVCLAGHSMGAKVAMLLALLRPDLVKSLVVIDNAPANEKLEENFYLDVLGMAKCEQEKELLSKSYEEKKKVAKDILSRYEPDKNVRSFIVSNIDRKPVAEPTTLFHVPAMNFLKDNILGELEKWPTEKLHGKTFNGNVLVIRGKQSLFIKDKHLEKDFPRYYPSFESVTLDAGHWVVQEQHEAFGRIMEEFLEKTDLAD